MDLGDRKAERLLNELACARRRIAELEQSGAGHKGAEEAPSASEEENYRAIFNAANDAIFVHDIETGEILDVNQKMCEMYGYTLQEARCLNVESLSMGIPPYTQENAMWLIRKAAKGHPQLFEWMARNKSGNLFWVEVSLKRVPLGKKNHMLAIVRDITQRKEAEEALREAKDRLEEKVEERTEELRRKNQELESFAYSVSHDLQAPLRTIQGCCRTLLAELEGQIHDKQRQNLAAIGKISEHMNRLIEDMLSYARLGTLSFSKSDVSLESVINYSQFELIEEIRAAGAEINISKPLPVVKGHERTLVRLMTNLLKNAIKFVPAGRQPVVQIKAEKRDDCVRVVVQDNGIGIPPQYREKIFGMFERLHSRETYPGSGVGLAIAKKAVELHGGRIGCDSKEGYGSAFWFELPNE